MEELNYLKEIVICLLALRCDTVVAEKFCLPDTVRMEDFSSDLSLRAFF